MENKIYTIVTYTISDDTLRTEIEKELMSTCNGKRVDQSTVVVPKNKEDVLLYIFKVGDKLHKDDTIKLYYAENDKMRIIEQIVKQKGNYE